MEAVGKIAAAFSQGSGTVPLYHHLSRQPEPLGSAHTTLRLHASALPASQHHYHHISALDDCLGSRLVDDSRFTLPAVSTVESHKRTLESTVLTDSPGEIPKVG